MRAAGQTVIEDRYRRLAAERQLLRWSAFSAACSTMLRAAWLNGIYVFQEVVPPLPAIAACAMGLLAFLVYVIGAGGGQAQRERLPLLRASVLLNLAAMGMAVYNFWVDHLRPEGSLGAMPTTASYGDLVRHFSRYHQNPDEDRSLEALGTFVDASLDTIAELMRFATVFAAFLYLRDKAVSRGKKTA